MAKVLITSGPTREYIDPVRYLSNASSGRMGQALAEAFLAHGHEVVIVSGPVDVVYPPAAAVTWVTTTQEMLQACEEEFEACDGVIGAAAPCDYRPERFSPEKLAKSGGVLLLRLVETPDILATLGRKKGNRWIVGFALETHQVQQRAWEKLRKKNCDLVIINRPSAIGSATSAVEVLAADGRIAASWQGDKRTIAGRVYELIEQTLLAHHPRQTG